MSGYTTRRCGSTGHEILDANGDVIAWTVDGRWAATIVALLNTLPPPEDPMPNEILQPDRR